MTTKHGTEIALKASWHGTCVIYHIGLFGTYWTLMLNIS